ncbi:unnamed protein product [Mortierella alpina]
MVARVRVSGGEITAKDDEEWEEDEGDEVVILLTTEHVYAQIGEMRKLDVLALDIDRSFENRMIDSDYAWNLTVSGGSLGELAGLKNLRSLELKANFGRRWTRRTWTKGRVALAQNLHHIRTIDLKLHLTHVNDVEALLETLAQGLPTISEGIPEEAVGSLDAVQSTDLQSSRCTNLKRVTFEFDSFDREIPWLWLLWTLLFHNRRSLTHLDLQLLDFDELVLVPALVIVSAMNQLQHLTLHTTFHSEAWFLAMLHACLPLPRLSELFCHFILEAGELSPSGDRTVDYEDRHFQGLATPLPKLKDLLDRAIAARTSPVNGSIDVKIKALRFPDLVGGDIDLIRLVLPMLTSGLVAIETLGVPLLLCNRPEELYQQLFRDHCPALRHLILPSSDEGSLAPNYAIQAATGLKTVRSFRFNDESGLSSRGMVRTLVKHHSKTLEEVDFMLCQMISSRDQQDLFVSCKQLKRFWLVPDGMSSGAHGIEFRDIITGAWGCLGMKELSLTLNRYINVEDAVNAMRLDRSKDAAGGRDLDEAYRAGDKKQKRRVAAWAAKQAFTQIGRLTALEHLALGGKYNRENGVTRQERDLFIFQEPAPEIGWVPGLCLATIVM